MSAPAAAWHVERTIHGWAGFCHTCQATTAGSNPADATERVRWHHERQHGRPGTGYVKEPAKPKEDQ